MVDFSGLRVMHSSMQTGKIILPMGVTNPIQQKGYQMTIATIFENDPDFVSRKGFNLVRRAKREQYNQASLDELKHAHRRLSSLARQTGKPGTMQEAEFVHQNIMLIQLCRGVI